MEAQVQMGAFPVLLALLPILSILISLVVMVVVLVALWRGMKAHESIAESLRRIAEK